MSNEGKNAKPRLAGRGFAQSILRLFISLNYRVGPASANACIPILPVALDGARFGVAMLWGGLQ